jgi:hypothetical protein
MYYSVSRSTLVTAISFQSPEGGMSSSGTYCPIISRKAKLKRVFLKQNSQITLIYFSFDISPICKVVQNMCVDLAG